MSKVSKLKPAVTPDIVDEPDKSMDIEPIVLDDENCDAKHVDTFSPIDLRNKISIMQCDITKVKCDAIVNAANMTLLGGGGIDGVIHKSAGPELLKKCKKIPIIGTSQTRKGVRCYPGQCKVTETAGTKLTNCRYVFHTVGPNVKKELDMNYNATILTSCYENCLQNVLNYNIRSIAFCCISTGIYGYDSKDAARVALDTVRLWLEKNHQSVNEIVFCTYTSEDYDAYNDFCSKYFPKLTPNNNSSMDKKEDHSIPHDSNLNSSESENMIISRESSDIDFDISPPIGLKNLGQNVCSNLVIPTRLSKLHYANDDR